MNQNANNIPASRTFADIFRTDVQLVDIRLDEAAFPRLRQLDEVTAIEGVKAIVLKAYLYRGQKSDPDDVQVTSSLFLEELLADADRIGTNNVTLQEVWRSVRKALLGQRKDPMYGVNVASLYAAVAEYCRNEGSEAEKKAQSRQASPSSVEVMMGASAAQFAKTHKAR